MKHPLFTASAAICWLLQVIGGTMSAAMASDASARSTDAGIELVSVVESGLQLPLFLTHAGDGSGQLFVVEQGGTIRIIDRGALQNTPFLDIRDRVWRKGDEQGLLGLAFHPDHKANGRFFAHYNRREDGATVVAEYSRQGRSLQAAGDSEHILMVVPQPYLNHNGGMIAFGPDRLLYIGRGDGGLRGDPHRCRPRPSLCHPPGQPVCRWWGPCGDFRSRNPEPLAVLVRPGNGSAVACRCRPIQMGRDRPCRRRRQLRLAHHGRCTLLQPGGSLYRRRVDFPDR